MQGGAASLISYDNVNIPFRVYAQRVDHQTTLGCGTAGMCYIKRDARALPLQSNARLREQHAQGLSNPLTSLDILQLELDAAPRLAKEMVYEVLRVLIDMPEFNLQTYKHRNSPFNTPLFAPPPDARTLPHSAEHITMQYMLETEGMPEASYEDQEKLIMVWLYQLELAKGKEGQKTLVLEQIIFWAGDQLTVECLRGLHTFRAEDFNSFDWLDWMLPVFGFLHLLMAFSNGLHTQYLGSGSGRGISQAIDVPGRKGLSHAQTKGPFFCNLDELLEHMLTAHLRLDWLNITKVDHLTEPRLCTPQMLVQLAQEIK
ncbi:hypothetical protein EV122DRAFT_227347 [Schizophyllum commune]